jgi:hypothetical protein
MEKRVPKVSSFAKIAARIAALCFAATSEAKSVGRAMTHDGAMERKPFIVDTDATMLKKSTGEVKLSRAARMIYLTMRALANGKTGELKIRGRWLKSRQIDAASEICRDIRLKAMRELQVLGYVTVKRERVLRVIGGRKRMVLGAVHYVVHRQPVATEQLSKTPKAKPILLESIPSTVEKIDSQFFSDSPVGDSFGSSALDSSASRQVTSANSDDYASYLERLKREYLARCEDPEGQIALALEIVCERILSSRIRVSSNAYFDVALMNFFEDENDREKLRRRLHTA